MTSPRRAAAIDLVIDELVLDGVGDVDRDAMVEALQQEIGRVVAEQGAPEHWGSSHAVARVDGGTIDLPPAGSRESAAPAGESTATAIAGALSRTLLGGGGRR